MIPGFIIAWLTFPGVMVHELAHKIFCQLTGTKVIEVCYFRFGNPAGYVAHEEPTSAWKHMLIGCGPLFVNTLMGLAMALLALPLKGSGEAAQYLYLVLMWLAISVAMHSFPSAGDAASIWAGLWRPSVSLAARVIGVPLVGFIYLGALGSVLWLDLVYGVSICMLLPEWVLAGERQLFDIVAGQPGPPTSDATAAAEAGRILNIVKFLAVVIGACITPFFWMRGKRLFGDQTHPLAIFILALIATFILVPLALPSHWPAGLIVMGWVTVCSAVCFGVLDAKARIAKHKSSPGD
jgi:hypothetical protein